MARNWYTAKTPVNAEEVTEAMLAPIRAIVEKTGLCQTVWPSRNYGKDFVGSDCLLVSMASVMVGFQGRVRPENAAPDSDPIVTLVPSYYHGVRAEFEEYGL